MKPRRVTSSDKTAQKLVDIESKDRLSARAIDDLCTDTELLDEYLKSSRSNTFSELLFRLTHEIYAEEKASALWHRIVAHHVKLVRLLHRDVGVLVAALDYLSNISGEMQSPKIIDDARLEDVAEVATRDPLTGLYTRGVFDFTIARMVLEHHRYRKPLSLLLLDLDDFKKVNDCYGHQAGDDVLRRVGAIVLDNVRKADFPARYGGEEICIVFPETPIEQSRAMANRLRRDIHMNFVDGGPLITASIGVTCARAGDRTTAKQLLRSADQALYLAKARGKDKVMSRQLTDTTSSR